MFEPNKKGFFPSTPATNLLYGLQEALRMLEEEGLHTWAYRRVAGEEKDDNTTSNGSAVDDGSLFARYAPINNPVAPS